MKYSSAYIAGSLTDLSPESAAEVKRLYESIAALCTEFDIEAYVPHLVSDPVAHPGMTAAEVYRIDRERVAASDLLIAYVGAPSLGTGIELEIARELGKVIILHAVEGARISRMARGVPGVRFVQYTTHEAAVEALRHEFESLTK